MHKTLPWGFSQFFGSGKRADCAAPKQIMVSRDGARAGTQTRSRNGISTGLKVSWCKGAVGCSSSTGLGESPKKIRTAPLPSVAMWLQNFVAQRGEAVATSGGCFLSSLVPGAWIAPYPQTRAASLHFGYPSVFHRAQRAIFSLQTLISRWSLQRGTFIVQRTWAATGMQKKLQSGPRIMKTR